MLALPITADEIPAWAQFFETEAEAIALGVALNEANGEENAQIFVGSGKTLPLPGHFNPETVICGLGTLSGRDWAAVYHQIGAPGSFAVFFTWAGTSPDLSPWGHNHNEAMSAARGALLAHMGG